MLNRTVRADLSRRLDPQGVVESLWPDYCDRLPPSAYPDMAIADCQECGDMGWTRRAVEVGHADFGKMYPCATCAGGPVRTASLLRGSGLPLEMHGMTFDALKMCHDPAWVAAHEAAWMFAQGGALAPWLVLTGVPGTGKTHLAAAIILHRVSHPEHGPTGRFVVVPELLDELRRGYRDDTYDPLMAALKSMPLLVLDDLGAQRDTDWVAERLYELLDARYRRRLQTVITTNVTGLRQHYEPRLADRLLSERSGVSLVCPLPGPSWR